MQYPRLVYGTPRKLPRVKDIFGRVVVLDIAFAANNGGATFEGVTLPFIQGLGERLAAWVDHHDHEAHQLYRHDSRFLLRTKAQHGACPEMISEELVARIGAVDSICCHTDFDGLCSAAKWIRGGREPYLGSDADARAIDTCIGKPSPPALMMDYALRAQPHDVPLRGIIVRYLAEGLGDKGLHEIIEEKANVFAKVLSTTQSLAAHYVEVHDLAVIFVPPNVRYDKTELLLIGQKRARISLVIDSATLTIAAGFESGVNLLDLLHLEGGMPTRVSVPARNLEDVLARLGASASDISTVLAQSR